jgi:hypothetical protein
MGSRDLVAKRLGISARQAGELLASQCRGTWRWTKADIAAAVREWTARYGQPPRDRDWRGGPGARVPRLHEPAAKWPDPKTVMSRFDNWEEAAFFALRGREWAADVIDADDPAAELTTTTIHEAIGQLLIDFLFDVRAGSTARVGLPDRQGGSVDHLN